MERKGEGAFGLKVSAGFWRDALAGLSLASMNIPQVLGYARIAGMPAVTGLYTVLLPLLAFAALGASRHLVVAADSATAAIFSGALSGMAPWVGLPISAWSVRLRCSMPGFCWWPGCVG